jgi:hypothetical protein
MTAVFNECDARHGQPVGISGKILPQQSSSRNRAMYNVLRTLENGELLLVRSFAELEEAKRLAAFLNECWPGEYCVGKSGAENDTVD